MPLTFCSLTERHLDAVIAIEQKAFPDPWSESALRDALSPPYEAIGVFLNEQLLGYAMCLSVLDEGQIMNIAITPSQQGQGLGGALLRDALKRLDARGIQRISLEHRADNHAAHRLYLSAGFTEIDRRAGYYQSLNPPQDAIVMARISS